MQVQKVQRGYVLIKPELKDDIEQNEAGLYVSTAEYVPVRGVVLQLGPWAFVEGSSPAIENVLDVAEGDTVMFREYVPKSSVLQVDGHGTCWILKQSELLAVVG